MKDTFSIGVITKPHGVRGELKVTLYNQNSGQFNKLKNVFIDGKTYSINGIKPCGDFSVISILGVNDRNLAEEFRGKEILVSRENLRDLGENEYYVQDIVGCKLLNDANEVVGKVVEVISAKTDVFVCKTADGKIMRFPFLKDLIVNVDVYKGEIVVKKSRLKEVACFED